MEEAQNLWGCKNHVIKSCCHMTRGVAKIFVGVKVDERSKPAPYGRTGACSTPALNVAFYRLE